MSYGRFAAMIVTSTVVMFCLMYLNTYLITHVFWSETRAYMALLMGSTMAIIMLAFMLSMYSSRKINAAIFAGAAVVFAASLWLVRSQITVGDTSYMRAMIPHHSIAIMTSSRADISDPRVRKLADEIIYAQDKEIAEMRYLISSIEDSGDEAPPAGETPAEIVDLETVLSTADTATLDPAFMTQTDIGRAFPDGARCRFSYTPDSPPVLAVERSPDGTIGVLKISGDLVQIAGEGTSDVETGVMLADSSIEIVVEARGGGVLPPAGGADEPMDASMTLKLTGGFSAGYHGYYRCRG